MLFNNAIWNTDGNDCDSEESGMNWKAVYGLLQFAVCQDAVMDPDIFWYSQYTCQDFN